MEKKYLNEQKYQYTKKKIIRIALLVLIIGILIGGSLIAVGIVKSSNVESSNSSEKAETPEKTAVEIQAEIDTLNNDLITLNSQKNQEFRNNGFSEEYYRLDNEINNKNSKIMELKSELMQIQSGFNDVEDEFENARKDSEKLKYTQLYIIGGFIILASCMIAASIYFFAKRREITAFTAQQVMPVTKEVVEDMAPTVGKVAKEISKGIKEGMKDDQK